MSAQRKAPPRWLIALAAGMAGSAVTSIADVRVRLQPPVVALDNRLVRVEFDLVRGEYHIRDATQPSVDLRDAHFALNQYRSAASGVAHSWRTERIADDLGRGRELIITSTTPDRTELRLGVTIYDNRAFVVLRAGFRNTTAQPIQITNFAPLADGVAFVDLPGKTRVKFLNGPSGAQDTLVTDGPFGESANNLLVTFTAAGQPRSLVVGGLTYHEFAKFASVGGDLTESARMAELEMIAPPGAKLTSYLNCGQAARTYKLNRPMLHVESPTPRVFREAWKIAPPQFGVVATAPREIVIAAHGFNPKSRYLLGFSWWDFDGRGRVQTVSCADFTGKNRRVLLEKQSLPNYRERGETAVQRAVPLPPEAVADGRLRLIFSSDTDADAVLSEVWIWGLPKNAPADEWEPQPVRMVSPQQAERIAPVRLYAEDPRGKRVDPGQTWLSPDKFYVDLVTRNPFEAAEQYGLAVRAAMRSRPNIYSFPTVCAWYASSSHPGCEYLNTTTALVGEMDHAVRSGFLRYAPVGVRIVPDANHDEHGVDNNEQGWWDDEHWRKYGHYTKPYETSAKWAGAVRERGGVPITYVQTGLISLDFVKAHPEWVLYNDASTAENPKGRRNNACNYDYTDPGFQQHLRQVWGNLREAGVKGVMFDYPGSGWRTGGFEDKYATTASAYRKIFEAVKNGLGPDSYIDERVIGQYGQPQTDLTVGVVDSQRTEWDTAQSTHDMYAKCGLRWYKNRVLYTYDVDAKNFLHVTPNNRDGLRQMLTMAYVTAPRILLGTSFRTMTPEQLHDLSRVFPLHAQPRSACPLDAFTGDGPFPRVYDFAVTADWHQLTLLNTGNHARQVISVELGASTADEGLGLEAGKFYHVYDFWNDRYVGRFAGSARLSQELRPGEARMLSVRTVANHPQVISTSRHLMQGFLDLADVRWHRASARLIGKAEVVGGEPFRMVFALNGRSVKNCSAEGARARVESWDEANGLAALILESPMNATVSWEVSFSRR